MVNSVKDARGRVSLSFLCFCYFGKHFLLLHIFLHVSLNDLWKEGRLRKLWQRLKSSLIKQKAESQNGCFKKTKDTKFSEKRTFPTPWYADLRVSFFGKFDVLCFLETPFLKVFFLDVCVVLATPLTESQNSFKNLTFCKKV